MNRPLAMIAATLLAVSNLHATPTREHAARFEPQPEYVSYRWVQQLEWRRCIVTDALYSQWVPVLVLDFRLSVRVEAGKVVGNGWEAMPKGAK